MHLTRRTTATFATTTLLGTALAACAAGTGDATPSIDTHQDVAVYTWWSTGAENEGLNTLVEVFEKQHPEIDFVDDGVTGGGGGAAKEHLQSRLENQDPPDTFVAHAGAELQDYIEQGYIQDVSGLYEEFGLTDVFPEGLMELLATDDGKIYSIPSNIHRANVMWVNPSVLAENDIDPSGRYDGIDDFIADLEKLRKAGMEAPLAVGTTWTQVHLFETVLLGSLGAEAYTGLWEGTTDWNGPEVTAALEDFRTILGYTNTDRMDLDWDLATQRVIDGESAFNVMGDWAVSGFDNSNQEFGEDYLAVPSPGSAGTFDFLADSFTLSAGILDEDSAKAWLETIGSKEAQIRFNKVKGAIPARSDIDENEFTEYQKMAIKSFQEDTIVSSMAHGAAIPVAHLNAITEATTRFNRQVQEDGGDIAAFQAELAAAASG
ncbi:ABC transporter substrate-binding protein [Myceligenerans pegani]|uniref:Probable sugar-binding periplasmic protein n=1 Tax=Myceligenerans pegani TaxID=2776917 RepID=A0ABR9MSG5_9MICO|nr:ABC transporter substrate-binding protein [Myceligenerans sp. TRM 65318]MBE1874323.1 carbohydrate ABC transporter substrate-binding protein [Myceligenerans sp. TRM 65318]MBE3016594.1 carbohydrate ABC transporter substrate-binding protein [Myceligenerans sp. TRM 65318]